MTTMLSSQKKTKWDYQLISNSNGTESLYTTMSEKEHNKSPPPQNERIDTHLVQWEEFALCIEEHFHAQELHKRNPNGKPLGHR